MVHKEDDFSKSPIRIYVKMPVKVPMHSFAMFESMLKVVKKTAIAIMPDIRIG